MELNGIQVEQHGSGHAVTVRLWLGEEQALTTDDTMRLAAAIVGVRDGLTREVAIGEPTSSEPTPPVEDETPKRGRGRRGKAADESRDSQRDNSTDNEATEDPTARPAGRRGRGRRSSSASVEPAASAGDAGEGEKSTSRGRGRRKSTASSGGEQEKSSGDGGETVSDEDLAKAVSAATERCGDPSVALEVLTDFGVTRIGKLPQEVRGEFLAQLENIQ